MKRATLKFPTPKERARLIELAQEAAKVAAKVRAGELPQEEGVKQLMANPFNMGRITAQSWFMTPVPVP